MTLSPLPQYFWLTPACLQQVSWSKPSGRAAEQEMGTLEMGEPGTALNLCGRRKYLAGHKQIYIFFLLQDHVYFSPLWKHSFKDVVMSYIRNLRNHQVQHPYLKIGKLNPKSLQLISGMLFANLFPGQLKYSRVFYIFLCWPIVLK